MSIGVTARRVARNSKVGAGEPDHTSTSTFAPAGTLDRRKWVVLSNATESGRKSVGNVNTVPMAGLEIVK